jgi:TolB-like protein/tetratricopeptide (TPR) repeat protein
VNDAPGERGHESPWDRLRRRKVVQWAVGYVAASWGLLQGLEYFIRTFAWPEQLQQLTTLALLIGLPIVLVLAWYHGDRGQQRITTPELGMLTLVLLFGGGVLWYFQRASETSTAMSPTPTAAALPTDASIAVLPFVNMSADKDQQFFADGISEELLNLLAQVPGLRVIARTSSFSFKGKDAPIAEIARTLNVANVLEGSVRKSGDTLRITAQLVRTSDSSQLWSQTYDRQMTDVFKVQDEIAAAVVSELQIKLLGRAPQAKPADPRAYALFLQAREIHRQSTPAAFEQSLVLYQQALALDPGYAAAWVGLAQTYFSQVNNGLRLADEGIRLAREATTTALALDPQYAPAHAQLVLIATYYDRDLPAAARHLEHALTLEPANPEIIGTAAVLARRLGRLDKAIAIGEYQIARDPVNAEAHGELGLAYRYGGRLDEAIAEYRAHLRLFPGSIINREKIGEVLLQKGDAKAALAEIQQEPDEASRLIGLSMAYHALGQPVESDAALAELIRGYERTSAYTIAYVLAYRGEADRAFEWLEKAIIYRDPYISFTAIDPTLIELRKDARWLPLLRRLGQAPEQLAAIKFDVKVPN